MNKERLSAIADMLDEVQAGTWRGATTVDRFDLDNWATQSGCGTTACALGFAALDPRFDWIELTADSEWNGTSYFSLWMTEEEPPREALGLDDETFDHLFMPCGYPDDAPATAADVAARIREVIA